MIESQHPMYVCILLLLGLKKKKKKKNQIYRTRDLILLPIPVGERRVV